MDLANINFNLYKCFIAVYEAQGYTKAMETLKMARNNIKLNIEALEAHLKTKLFMGHPRGVEPTSDAEKLYPKIKASFNEIIKAEDDLRDFTSESEAVIRMIIPATMVGTILGEFFKEFNLKYPNVKLELLNRADKENYNEFVLGGVDLVIDLETVLQDYNLKTINILKIHNIFIASKKFLAKRGLTEKISISDFERKCSVIGHKATFKMVATEINNYKFSPYLELATLEPILPLVKLGTGIGLYGREYLEKQDSGDVIEVTVDEIDKSSTIRILCGFNEQALTKAAKVFLDELLKFCSGF